MMNPDILKQKINSLEQVWNSQTQTVYKYISRKNLVQIHH